MMMVLGGLGFFRQHKSLMMNWDSLGTMLDDGLGFFEWHEVRLFHQKTILTSNGKLSL
jgi:hypothetical protein